MKMLKSAVTVAVAAAFVCCFQTAGHCQEALGGTIGPDSAGTAFEGQTWGYLPYACPAGDDQEEATFQMLVDGSVYYQQEYWWSAGYDLISNDIITDVLHGEHTGKIIVITECYRGPNNELDLDYGTGGFETNLSATDSYDFP